MNTFESMPATVRAHFATAFAAELDGIDTRRAKLAKLDTMAGHAPILYGRIIAEIDAIQNTLPFIY